VLFSLGELGVPAPNTLAVLVADLTNVYGEFCGKIHEVLPDSLLHPRCRYLPGEGYRVGITRAIRLANGSRWLFRSSESGQISLSSFTASGGWIDEPPKKTHYYEFVRGLASRDAPLWVTLTPIGRPVDWFRDRIEGNEEWRSTGGRTGTPPEEEWEQHVAELSHVECPWRSEESIAAQVASTDVAERPQRIHAAWEGVTPDREFTGWGPECELAELPDIEESVQFGVWMDHGERAGREFVLLACWLERGPLYVLDEYVSERPTTELDDARSILAMLERNDLEWWDVDNWVGDVNTAGKSVAGSSVNEEIARYLGVLTGHPAGRTPFKIDKPSKAPGSVGRGIRTINSAFMRGQIYVLNRCHRLRYALQHSRGEEDLKHGLDALAYGAVPVVSRWSQSNVSRLRLRGR